MATLADLEGFERTFRFRASGDEQLLKQVFGETELEGLTKSSPSLIETARSYFPYLTSSTYERLAREPDALRSEQDRCRREMEQLAVQNYGVFIGSTKVTQAVRQELADIQRCLDEAVETLEPLQDQIRTFQAASGGLATRRSALRGVLQQHGTILELLELPQLLEACVRNQMYEESLELLAFSGNLLQVHEARGEDVPILAQLREQVAVQRTNLHNALLAQLKTDIHLPACVRVIGFLRRIQRHPEDELRTLFIEHRGAFLEGQKHQVELLRATRGSVVTALRNAADLLRTHVYDIGTQYKALFPQDDGPLNLWLTEQILWLTGLLQSHLLPPKGGDRQASVSKAPSAPSRGAKGGAPPAAAASARIDAATLTTVLRQCLHASATLKRLGGHFFPSVAGIFEARMEHLVCEMLDSALLTFHKELGRYDWVPSTALSGSLPAPGSGATEAGAPGWLHPQALELTRHRPLAVLTNDIVQMFNELRQCTLYGLRMPVVLHCSECLVGAINLLRAARGAQTLLTGTPKATEFLRLCRHFAHILTPLVAAHLEAVFGASARLDVATIVSSMTPDLLPASEVELRLPAGTLADASEEANTIPDSAIAAAEAAPQVAPAAPAAEAAEAAEVAAAATAVNADSAPGHGDAEAGEVRQAVGEGLTDSLATHSEVPPAWDTADAVGTAPTLSPDAEGTLPSSAPVQLPADNIGNETRPES